MDGQSFGTGPSASLRGRANECGLLAGRGGQEAAAVAGRADAELIVVGRRGHGGFKRLLLGSGSQQVVHYAERPVVVVNQPATDS